MKFNRLQTNFKARQQRREIRRHANHQAARCADDAQGSFLQVAVCAGRATGEAAIKLLAFKREPERRCQHLQVFE
jgi:hypothetical protein